MLASLVEGCNRVSSFQSWSAQVATVIGHRRFGRDRVTRDSVASKQYDENNKFDCTNKKH